jgi:hypothetical protein
MAAPCDFCSARPVIERRSAKRTSDSRALLADVTNSDPAGCWLYHGPDDVEVHAREVFKVLRGPLEDDATLVRRPACAERCIAPQHRVRDDFWRAELRARP